MNNKDLPVILVNMEMYFVKDEDGSGNLYDRQPVLIKAHGLYVAQSGSRSYYLTPREVQRLPYELAESTPGRPVSVVLNAHIDTISINLK